MVVLCLLHLNELPFRHLSFLVDGGMSSPTGFKGPIGKLLADCETLPVVSFRRLPFEDPGVDVDALSSDQRYLLRMCKAVSEGCCSQQLAATKPGPPDMSRWTTAAGRTLRLYVSTRSPSPALKTLAKYIVQVYAPVWFMIKTKPKCIYGARHLHQLIKRSRYLPADQRATVDAAIQTSGFFAHPENVLLSMLFDERYDLFLVAVFTNI